MTRSEKRRQRKKTEKAAKGKKPIQLAKPSPERQMLTIQQAIDVALQHHNAGRLPEAEGIYQQILQADPNQFVALHMLGLIAHQVGKNDIAVDLITKALAINPDFAEAHYNLGNALRDLGRLDEAVASYHKTIAIRSDFAEAHSNLGNVLMDLGKLDVAAVSYQKALAINPSYAEVRSNLGILQLLKGDLQDGWENFAWRRHVNDSGLHPRDYKEPFWDGSALEGKTIFIYPDQGLGDTIMFARYLPLVAACGGRVIFEVPKPLFRLFQGMEHGADLLKPGEPTLPFDCHAPLFDLPRFLNTTLETIPANIPYLSAESDRVEQWNKRIGDEGLRVGIAWQGNPEYKLDNRRSFPLTAFSKFPAVEGLRIISLQKHFGEEQLQDLPPGMVVENLGEDLDAGEDAFIDTAAVMMSLDLIITCDTAIGHLAGALGCPVWVALAFSAECRWMREREDTPWYPTMRLFRQSTIGDWAEVFEKIGKALHDQSSQDC